MMKTTNPNQFLKSHDLYMDYGLAWYEAEEEESECIYGFMEHYGITDYEEGKKRYQEWAIDQVGAYNDGC